jgi:hypothetical protein
MSLQPSKYKVFTKQVYNHLIDEYGDDNMNVGVIMNHINNDELLRLLLKNVKRTQKVEIAFMVYFFSQTNDLESSFSKVRGNLINIGMYHYRDLGYRDITCHECDGSGTEYCGECYGNGEVECNNCDGNGTEECRNCDGSGEVDGEACSDCQGNQEMLNVLIVMVVVEKLVITVAVMVQLIVIVVMELVNMNQVMNTTPKMKLIFLV